MKINAPVQEVIILMLVNSRRPMSLREITHNSSLTYHQVASCLSALTMKGYLHRIKTGVYEMTEEARVLILSPEEQVKVLRRKVELLESELKSIINLRAKIIWAPE